MMEDRERRHPYLRSGSQTLLPALPQREAQFEGPVSANGLAPYFYRRYTEKNGYAFNHLLDDAAQPGSG